MANKRKSVSPDSTKKVLVSLKRVESSLRTETRRGVALTPEQRRAIKESPLSYRKLAEILHVNVKTIAKWKHSRSVYGRTRGPKGGKSKSLTIENEEKITYYYAASGKTIDQCLKNLVKTFPLLTRSTFYRCIQRVGARDMGKFHHLVITSAVSRLRSPVNSSSNDDDD